MRGDYQEGGDLFSCVLLEQRIPKRHPISKMRKLVDEALTNLDSVFDEIYADCVRPSIPPERLIHAYLLQAGVRSAVIRLCDGSPSSEVVPENPHSGCRSSRVDVVPCTPK